MKTGNDVSKNRENGLKEILIHSENYIESSINIRFCSIEGALLQCAVAFLQDSIYQRQWLFLSSESLSVSSPLFSLEGQVKMDNSDFFQ